MCQRGNSKVIKSTVPCRLRPDYVATMSICEIVALIIVPNAKHIEAAIDMGCLNANLLSMTQNLILYHLGMVAPWAAYWTELELNDVPGFPSKIHDEL